MVIAAFEILRLRSGVQVVTHWTDQPMFSWAVARQNQSFNAISSSAVRTVEGPWAWAA